jgi:hypothetical protein
MINKEELIGKIYFRDKKIEITESRNIFENKWLTIRMNE